MQQELLGDDRPYPSSKNNDEYAEEDGLEEVADERELDRVLHRSELYAR